MKMYVWSDHYSFIGIAQAESVAQARQRMLEEVGESGDGSCPERDKARRTILQEAPNIWYGVNAEFALTDSAERRETVAENERLRTALEEAKRIVSENMRCNHPAQDGSDDSCDGEDCIKCGVILGAEAAREKPGA